jgi:hypothetical protein
MAAIAAISLRRAIWVFVRSLRMAMVSVTLRAITRHATLTTAIARITRTTWAVRLKEVHVRLLMLATVIVTSRATTRSATLMAASALITQTTWVVACPPLAPARTLPTVNATLAASTRSAITMAAIAAIVHVIVPRVHAVLAQLLGAMGGQTDGATAVASTRLANGMAAIAAIFRRLVI